MACSLHKKKKVTDKHGGEYLVIIKMKKKKKRLGIFGTADNFTTKCCAIIDHLPLIPLIELIKSLYLTVDFFALTVLEL